MQVVIEVTTELYDEIKNGIYDDNTRKMAIAIGNGIILPEHGDLIDRNNLPMRDISPDAWYSPMIGCLEDDLDEVPVIVPRTEVTE